MTTIFNQVKAEWGAALKNHDSAKTSIFSLIRNEIKTHVINTYAAGSPERPATGDINPNDDLAITVLKKMAKTRRESIAEYEGVGRSDLAQKEYEEFLVISQFLPKALTEAELIPLVKEAIAETQSSSMKDMGKAMKAAMAKVAGRADGKDVQAIVKQMLSV